MQKLLFCIVFNCIRLNNADIYAGIVFVSYTGHYPALYSSYCEPVAVPVGVSFFSTLNVGFGLLCALSQLAQIAPFLSLVFSSVNPSEMHHSPDRAMSERRARDDRDKKCRFFDQKRTKITLPYSISAIKLAYVRKKLYLCANRAAIIVPSMDKKIAQPNKTNSIIKQPAK